MRKGSRYRELLLSFLGSESLQRLRISRRCFRLLDKALIDPENLTSFYKTYRLPCHQFFPLFLSLKRSYLMERRKWQEERERYIWEQLKALPPQTVRFIRFLAEWEQEQNPKSEFPFWMKHLLPHTKKRLYEYQKFNSLEWYSFFYSYLTGLTARYNLNPHPLTEKLAACSMLELIPSIHPFSLPEKRIIMKAYRSLCCRYHPDRGGDPAFFVKLQESREILCLD